MLGPGQRNDKDVSRIMAQHKSARAREVRAWTCGRVRAVPRGVRGSAQLDIAPVAASLARADVRLRTAGEGSAHRPA